MGMADLSRRLSVQFKLKTLARGRRVGVHLPRGALPLFPADLERGGGGGGGAAAANEAAACRGGADEGAASAWVDGIIRDLLSSATPAVSIPQLIHNVARSSTPATRPRRVLEHRPLRSTPPPTPSLHLRRRRSPPFPLGRASAPARQAPRELAQPQPQPQQPPPRLFPSCHKANNNSSSAQLAGGARVSSSSLSSSSSSSPPQPPTLLLLRPPAPAQLHLRRGAAAAAAAAAAKLCPATAPPSRALPRSSGGAAARTGPVHTAACGRRGRAEARGRSRSAGARQRLPLPLATHQSYTTPARIHGWCASRPKELDGKAPDDFTAEQVAPSDATAVAATTTVAAIESNENVEKENKEVAEQSENVEQENKEEAPMEPPSRILRWPPSRPASRRPRLQRTPQCRRRKRQRRRQGGDKARREAIPKLKEIRSARRLRPHSFYALRRGTSTRGGVARRADEVGGRAAAR
uniref:Uncharacterized protein n=1 Tax=Ananas comosus var. bracteatus TaxID=296719 RepID=A0A6V7NS68_ANACO|nr:unnamed protein product [Ananas comosus var. bracteatus]